MSDEPGPLLHRPITMPGGDDDNIDGTVPVAPEPNTCGYEVDGEAGTWAASASVRHPRGAGVFPRFLSVCLDGLPWDGPPAVGTRFRAGPDRQDPGAVAWAAAYDGIHHEAWAEITVVAADGDALTVDLRACYRNGEDVCGTDPADLSGRLRLERHAAPSPLWIN